MKFADLTEVQIKELQKLEEKLDFTLLAYDISTSGNESLYGDTSEIINPS